MFYTGTLDGFKSAVNRWLLPWVVFSLVFRGVGTYVGLRKQFLKVLPTWACTAGFNNSNDNNKK